MHYRQNMAIIENINLIIPNIMYLYIDYVFDIYKNILKSIVIYNKYHDKLDKYCEFNKETINIGEFKGLSTIVNDQVLINIISKDFNIFEIIDDQNIKYNIL